MKRNYYSVPLHVAYTEAAELYRLMAVGECNQVSFLERRHQILYDNLFELKKQVFTPGTNLLIEFLKDVNILETAGGEAFVRKVFNNLEPLEDCA